MSNIEEAKWYVVHTYSGYENKVMNDLIKMVENRGIQDLIQDVRVPLETVTEIGSDGEAKEVERKLFPGYVLLKMVVTPDTWYLVRNTRGCTGFVGPASKPVPLTEKEVEALGVEKRSIEVDYNVGDNVEIIDGPFEGRTGIVDELDIKNNNVRITISIFGRETPVDLELNQIRVVED